MPNCQSYGCSNKSSGKSFKEELKMICFFNFPDPKKYKAREPEPERWLHNIGTWYTVESFFISKALLSVVITFMPTVLKSIMGNTSKK